MLKLCYISGIVSHPQDIILFVSSANTDVEFECRYERASISWKVNGTINPQGFPFNETFRGNISIGKLVFTSRFAYNQTTIQCIGDGINREGIESNVAILAYQGN